MQTMNTSQLMQLQYAALQASENAIVITDVTGRIIWINNAFTKLTGYTFDEVHNKTHHFLRSGEQDAEFYQQMWDTILNGSAWQGELVNRRKDGTFYIEEQTITPVKNLQGNITHFIGVKHNITERKKYEQKVEASERFSRAILRSLPSVMVIINERGEIIDANQTWHEYAYKKAGFENAAIGHKLKEVLTPIGQIEQAILDEFDVSINKLIEGQLNEIRMEFPLKTSKGIGWGLARGVRFVDEDALFIILTHEDITEQKQVEESERRQRLLAEALRDSIMTLSSILDPDKILGQLLDSIRMVVPHDAGNIMSIVGSIGRVDFCCGYDEEMTEHIINTEYALQAPIFHQMFIHSQPFMISDTEKYPGWKTQEEFPVFWKTRSYLGTPIIIGGVILGFINLESQTPNFFTQDHIDSLWIFAQQAAIAIQNAQLYNELDNNSQEVFRLNRATSLLYTQLSSAYTVEEIARQIVTAANEAFGLVDSGVILVDEYQRMHRLARAGTHAVITTAPLSIDGPGIVPECARTGTTIYAPEVDKDPHYAANSPDTRSEIAVPMISSGRVIGVFDAQSSKYDAFNERDQKAIQAFAERAAFAIENVQLHEKLLRHAADLEQHVQERTAQLNYTNERMSAILNNTSDAILLIKADNTIDISNPAFHHLFIYEQEEVYGQEFDIITTIEHRAMLREMFQAVMRDGNSRRTEIIAQRKSQSTFEAEITLSHVKSSENHVVCNIHDISHFKNMERMKDEFISMIGHELRTPLASILLISNALQKYYDRMEDHQRLDKLRQLNVQAEVLTQLVQTVLDISRIEAHSATNAKMKPVDLQDILQSVVEELSPNADEKELEVEVFSPNHDVIVAGDPMDFVLIWRNLINNAIKYTPQKGKIWLRMVQIENAYQLHSLPFSDKESILAQLNFSDQHYIIAQVEDTGHGIHENDMTQLFTRFYRGWAKESNIPGTGLGLSLVKDLLKTYQGGILVKSVYNEGSIFTFYLPTRNS
jgi:PAS domain S-box-containing protein